MGGEFADDLEGTRDDADDAIGAPQEDIIGAGRDAGHVAFLYTGQDGNGRVEGGAGTSKSEAVSASGSLTWETSKNLNGFHCVTVSGAHG